MKLKLFTLFNLVFTAFAINAQKQLTVSDIYSGTFSQKYADEVRSLKNGTEFTMLNYNSSGSSIDVYNYKSFQKTKTLVSLNTQITSYSFSPDQSKILIGTNEKPIYRRSSTADYIVYNTIDNSKIEVAKQIMEPIFSKDGSKIVYAFENNLFIKDLKTLKVQKITSDGKKNHIINGISDWVYEEEFSIVRMFDINADGSKIAYLKFDETAVPEYSMYIYAENLYPKKLTFKYPKAGENNSVVSLWVYDVKTKKSTKLNIENPYYIPRFSWTDDKNTLAIRTLNRHQNDLKMYYYNVAKNSSSIVYAEKDNAYVEVESQKLFIANDKSFFITSEKDGFNHIYHYDSKGNLLKQITSGSWEVTDFYGYNPVSKTLFYESTERGSINRDVYSISEEGDNKTLLSKKLGTNYAEFSADFSYFINFHSSSTEPSSVNVYETKTGNLVKNLVDNQNLVSKVDSFSKTRKEFSTININGNDLNMWMLKPEDFSPNKKYPVLMYQYSGPGSQSVKNRWFTSDDYWYLSLTQKGYIVVCVDGRGTGFKGANFKKVTQLQLGKYEVEDQITVAETLANMPFVDRNRIGIWGWSFGGFMSSNCILKGNHIFKMAISVAPVTSWRFYDSIYTERYMTTPQENPNGYDDNSPLNFTNLLKGKYLLIHGTADDNVHFQNAMRLTEKLVQNNKPFQMAVYPDKNHGIYGGKTRIQLYEKMTDFILNNL